MRRLIFVLLALLVTACTANAPLRKTTLYDDLGGKAGVDAIVNDLLNIFADDPRVAPFFANTNIPRFGRLFAEYLCRAADGGCEYTGSDMQESHIGLGITEKSFNAVVEGLQQAMDKNHVPLRAQNRLLAKLAPQRKDIVHR